MAREISRQTFLRGAAGALAAGTVFGSVRAAADPMTSGWDGLSPAIGGPSPAAGQRSIRNGEAGFQHQLQRLDAGSDRYADIGGGRAKGDDVRCCPQSQGRSAQWWAFLHRCVHGERRHGVRPASAARRNQLRRRQRAGHGDARDQFVATCTKRWPRQAEASRRVSARRSVSRGTPLAAASVPSPGTRACSLTRWHRRRSYCRGARRSPRPPPKTPTCSGRCVVVAAATSG